jgi:APA family basic amino acid/polyamine antiporter
MASVLLVFQVGQPRIWMSMSRDGLLPRSFSKIHPRFKTPYFSTIIAGILVAIPSLFMNLTEVTDLTSIGTLFAFILVSGGVLVLQSSWKKNDIPKSEKGFQVPYLNSRYFLPIIWTGLFVLLYYWNRTEVNDFINTTLNSSGNLPDGSPLTTPHSLFTIHWSFLRHLLLTEFPILIFILTAILLTFYGIRNQLSLIPVLGLLTNSYLMAQLGVTNWLRFLVWLAIGLIIYFSYGRRHSKLDNQSSEIMK